VFVFLGCDHSDLQHEDSYLLYARPNNGLVFEYNRARFTNQYVVSHCSQLLFLFDYHINVKISTGFVKYHKLYLDLSLLIL